MIGTHTQRDITFGFFLLFILYFFIPESSRFGIEQTKKEMKKRLENNASDQIRRKM